VSWTAHFRGGPIHGQSFPIPDCPPTFLVPEPVPVTELIMPPEPAGPAMPAVRYQLGHADPTSREVLYTAPDYTAPALPPGTWQRGEPIPTPPPPGIGVELLQLLAPLVEERDPYAMILSVRIVTSDDWDAEAQAIAAGWATMIERTVALIEAWIAEAGQLDQLARDEDPDLCWRCNAVKVDDPVGICDPCRADLTATTEDP
jgi:hypothetical protein